MKRFNRFFTWAFGWLFGAFAIVQGSRLVLESNLALHWRVLLFFVCVLLFVMADIFVRKMD